MSSLHVNSHLVVIVSRDSKVWWFAQDHVAKKCMVFFFTCSDFQHRRECMSQQEGGIWQLQTVLWKENWSSWWGWTLEKAYVRGWVGLKPWSMSGIWISRCETYAKILRWQKMLRVPGRGETVTVLAEAGGLVGVLGTGE